MKKLICLFILLCTSALYAQGVLDYFPTAKDSIWEYTSDNGTVTDTILMYDSSEVENGLMCYLFLDKTLMGTTSTLYGFKDNKIITLAVQNVLGQTRKYYEPYPLVLGTDKLKYEYENGELNKCTVKKASICFDDKKYEDCLLVTEESYSDDKRIMTTKKYYARNVGLVYVTLINSTGKETVFQKLKQYCIGN